MAAQRFEGRTAAEAAIKACETFGVSRADLKYSVVTDEGEGLNRRVAIMAEPGSEPRAAAVPDTVAPDDERPPRRDERFDRGGGGRDRGDRGGNRGGGGRDRGGRDMRGD